MTDAGMRRESGKLRERSRGASSTASISLTESGMNMVRTAIDFLIGLC